MAPPLPPRMTVPVRPDMSLMQILNTMAEENPGARSAMVALIESNYEQGSVPVMTMLLRADDMNLRGPQLWAAYKYVCDFNAVELYDRITMRDPSLVEAVNKLCPVEEYLRPAVVKGGSLTR